VKTSTNNNVVSGEPINRTDVLPTSENTRYFSSLVDAYKPSLERDSTLIQYVERIGALFFGLKQKTSSTSTNPFENLMHTLTTNLSNGPRGGYQHHHQSDIDLDVD